uniref:Uncharacterized protein n=1 Tax=viral metagenome TaxID=1070528 RepID=A0A6M3LC30_9ZZZZ
MTTPTTKPIVIHKPLKKKRKRKINTQKVKELARHGVIPSDIARNQGVAVSTITRYLQSIGQQVSNIKNYTVAKADALALTQLKAQTVSDFILENWIEEREHILSQDLSTQKEMLKVVEGVRTYSNNSENLERGKATNITNYRGMNLTGTITELREALSAQ